MTLSYEEIYSKFLLKINDPSFASLSNEDAYSLMCEYLHSGASRIYVRKIFGELSFNDEELELSFKLVNSVDEESDIEFVIGILSDAMQLQWIEPQLASVLLTKQFIGGKEEKYNPQSNQLTAMMNLKKMLEANIKKHITEYGYVNGVYGKKL